MQHHKALLYHNHQLIILDQTQLPHRLKYLRLTNYRQIIGAIKRLQIRGAPLLGIAAAYGLVLESNTSLKNLRSHLFKVAQALKTARPTAVNLSWAVDQMLNIIKNKNIPTCQLNKILLEQARYLEQKEINNSLLIGQYGAPLIKNHSTIMTICNTGWLAAPGIGTALGIIYTAHQQGKKIHVYVLETRPLLQGSRLTAFELTQAKIPYTIITDNMMATVMKDTNLVIIGADRIARNGDTANKIGSLTLAITAQYYKVPFYVAAPTSTIDLTKQTGQDIPIEQRSAEEIICLGKKSITVKNAPVYNPAFDVTPHHLITAIITEQGILKSPYSQSIAKLCV